MFLALLQILETVDDSLLVSNSTASAMSNDDHTINLVKLVDSLRNGRLKMIRNYEEYRFLFRAILSYSQNKEHYDGVLKAKKKSGTGSDNDENRDSMAPQGAMNTNPLITYDTKGNQFFDGYLVYE